jgi:cob(I)alamin adenosyltransferase
MLSRIQNDLFDLGADLATPHSEQMEGALRIEQAQVDRLEQEIDSMNESLEPLNSFVLPGGSPASAHLHLARTICRRAERDAIAVAEQTEINPVAIKYLNRLSDHLFVLGRFLNDGGQADVLWVPGDNR